MEISASDVKKLREQTGAGMVDCKNALVSSKGDFKEAVKLLKEQGLAIAAKRSGRITKEGSIFTLVQGNKSAIVEVSCETDFVARNNDFKKLGKSICALVLEKNLSDKNAEIDQMIQETISVIKENIAFRRCKTVQASPNEMLVDYVHGEGRIGVIVKLSTDKPETLTKEAVKAFAFDCALHTAAFSPLYLSKEKADAAYLKEQEEIFTKQAEGLNKPANVLAGIIKGKIEKHLASVCFVDQPFVKNDKLTVQQMADTVGKEVGAKIAIADYCYYQMGEELN